LDNFTHRHRLVSPELILYSLLAPPSLRIMFHGR
jgi:hypothetical protein